MLKPVPDLTTVIQRTDFHTLLSPGTFFFTFDCPGGLSVHQPTLWDLLAQFISPFAEKVTDNESVWIKRRRQWDPVHSSERPFEELSLLKMMCLFPLGLEIQARDHPLIKWRLEKVETHFIQSQRVVGSSVALLIYNLSAMSFEVDTVQLSCQIPHLHHQTSAHEAKKFLWVTCPVIVMPTPKFTLL